MHWFGGIIGDARNQPMIGYHLMTLFTGVMGGGFSEYNMCKSLVVSVITFLATHYHQASNLASV